MVKAPIELIWEAHTNPEHVRNWMLGANGYSMPVCDIDLRKGGAWHFIWRPEHGEDKEMRGIFREVRAPGRLVFTESWGDDWPETVQTLSLTAKDGRTTLTTTIVFESKEARDHAIRMRIKDRWAFSYFHLDKYLPVMARRRCALAA